MVLYSSTASTVIYFSYGALDLPFAAWISFWCSVGVLIGALLFDRLLKNYKRQSVIVFILAAILALSAVVVPYTNLQDLFLKDNVISWQLNSICE
jgi:uncharacterized membrane protein YfcA